MAQSKDTMARLDRLEGTFAAITDILVLQGERLDGMREEMKGMREAMGAVTDRLDRLIAITVKERTSGVERLARIEERLARLEAHVGI